MTKSALKINESVIWRLSEYPYKKGEKAGFLIMAITYEDRGFISLTRAVESFDIREVFIFEFNVKDYLSREVFEKWKKEKEKVQNFLTSKGIEAIVKDVDDKHFGDVFSFLRSKINSNDLPIVDISTLPKNYILKIASEVEAYNPIFLYTKSENHIDPQREEKKVGVSKIIPIDGFEGQIEINAETLLVLILGFEGNRAVAFLNEFQCEKILALVGAPGIGKNDVLSNEDLYYINHVESNNVYLLKNSFVIPIRVNSLDHYLFSEQLEKAINDHISYDKATNPTNIVVACMGTKVQTLGVYKY